jgi:DNA mismatch repair ATPase MutS
MGIKLRKDPEIHSILDALGEIETLLAHDKFSRQFPGPVCLPTIIEADQHQLTVENLWNAPIGAASNAYVGNDISLVQERLNFITGPNSGGKTALCKTLCQAQILGQSGGYVPAIKMSLSVVRHVYYQAPEAGSLETAQGRFATELERTRDIFFNSSGCCLVVLDEPFEGTSYEERLEITKQVLDGFLKIGTSVLFITHNFPLVYLFRERNIGQFLETEFENDVFTYRFKNGIANTSHAAYVVTQLGFTKEDIANYSEK